MAEIDEFPRGAWRQARRPFRTSRGRPVTPGTFWQIVAQDQEGHYVLFDGTGASAVLPRSRVKRDTRAVSSEVALCRN